jgi:DNA-binding MarR family transcriptional regulator
MNSSNRDRDEVARRLLRGVASLDRELKSVRLPFEVTQERLSTLSLIEQNAPISITALAILENVRPPTMSRMAASLFQDGLLTRRDHKTDGRGVLVSLTAKGRRVLKRARADFERQLLAAIGEPIPHQVSALKELVDAMGARGAGRADR